VDVALGPWPEQAAQREGIERDLRGAVKTKLCVRSGGLEIQVTLENALVGHAWPSGVTHARRAWVELLLERDGALLERIGGESPEAAAVAGSLGSWVFRSRMFDAVGAEVHTTWSAARTVSNLLLPTSTLDPSDPRFYHAQTRVFRASTDAPDRITLNVYLKPLGTDVLDDLVQRGALDPAVAARVPVFRLAGASKVWRRDSRADCGVPAEL
jgi:hypothetical protein